MDICLLNDSFPPVLDGVANAVLNYAQVLTGKGDRVLVGTPQYPDAKDDYPFPVLRYPSVDTTKLVGYRTGVPFSFSTFYGFEKQPIELIHCHCPMVSAVLAKGLRHRKNAPIIFTYHTKYDIDIANVTDVKLFQSIAERFIVEQIESFDEVWAVSQGAADNLRSLGYEGPYYIMENGVDLPCGRPDAAAIAAVSRQYALPEGVPVFLFVGRLRWYKGLRLILDALAALQARGRDFRMLFVGRGKDEEAVRACAQELGLGEKCIFTGPIQNREHLRAFYARADLFLFPSTFDTNGLAVREAAASAVASVLIAGSAAAEGAVDAQNAICIAESAQALAAALEIAWTAPEAVRRLGERAQAELYISWETAVSRARARYEVVLENWRQKRGEKRPGHRLER